MSFVKNSFFTQEWHYSQSVACIALPKMWLLAVTVYTVYICKLRIAQFPWHA